MAITLLIASNNANIEELKKLKPKESKHGSNLFHILLANFSYLIVVEIFLVFMNLFFPAFNSFLNLSFIMKLFFFSLNCFLLTHILLLNLRNVSDLYHALISKGTSK
jgi:hypothetical protein